MRLLYKLYNITILKPEADAISQKKGSSYLYVATGNCP